MTTIKTFEFDATELQERMTYHCHQTLGWLCNENIISEEQYEDLCDRLILVPVRNNTMYGRIKEWMFGKDKNDSIYKFVICDIKHK